MAHQADLKQRQKTLNDMKANAVARTDNDLLDDVMADGTSVAAARDQKAKEGAEAKAKREADAKAEAKRLKEMKANASARTDHDLLDDVTADGQSVAAAREAKAAEGAAAREAEAARAKASEQELKDLKGNTKARTDDGDGTQF